MKTASRWLTAFSVLPAAIFGILSANAIPVENSGQILEPAKPPEPSLVLGNEACVKCHTAEVQVWKKTPHASTFEQLHRKPEAKTIASKLGLNSIKNSGRCVACHYTQQQTADATTRVISGVSCESCHGAAKNWMAIHHDFGGEDFTRLDESPTHRRKCQSRHAKPKESILDGAKLSPLSYHGGRGIGQCRRTSGR